LAVGVEVDLSESGAADRLEVNIAGLILAGGASSRMGSPKALLPAGSESFVDRLISVFGETCDSTWVVLGHDAERIRSAVRRAGEARFVVNPHPEHGQSSSLACGLRAIGDGADAVMFTPVDYPSIQAATIRALRAAMESAADRPLLAIPRHDGRRGHPVCVSRALIPEFLALPPDGAARDVIRRHGAEVFYVEVDDPGILRDIDTPEDYRRIVGAS
jgi:molybdenum cofactor cytidylyltransferase